MKTIYYFKHLTAVIVFLLMSMNVFSQFQTRMGVPIYNPATQEYSVSVTAVNYPANVGHISLVMNYDAVSLSPSSITLNSGLVSIPGYFTDPNNLTDPKAVPGEIRLSYTQATAIALNTAAPLFTVTFKPLISGEVAPLSWSILQGENEFASVAPSSSVIPCGFTATSITLLPLPTIVGSLEVGGVPATLSGATVTETYTTEASTSHRPITNYVWNFSRSTGSGSPAGTVDAITGGGGPNDNFITITWTLPKGQQYVSVNYTTAVGSAPSPTVYWKNYYPFAGNIDATTVPQFVDPLPHFAAGLRVDATAGGDLWVRSQVVHQKALSTGTPVIDAASQTPTTIGNSAFPNAGLGAYQGYEVAKDAAFTTATIPGMWPAQTIVAKQNVALNVHYSNEIPVATNYSAFNILADQTLMMNGFPLNGDALTEPYAGPIPMVVHLHGGEVPSNSDGGPTAWFMPKGYAGPNALGPGFAFEASQLCNYPNAQEGTTLWYHPHDQGLTRINVFTGLAGYYFLRGTNEDAMKLPGFTGDGLVKEQTPTGLTPTFNGATPYLPEIELAVQDRMFNVNGELYWPVTPTNPESHPFWTPEFFGDVMTVNGKSWPYLSVAPRKYAFRLLDGSNARFLHLWIEDAISTNPGLKMEIVSSEGGFLDAPTVLDPAAGDTLLIAPAERPIIILDFTGMAGHEFILRNNAPYPYPTGTPIMLNDQFLGRIMKFVVNGTLVGADLSQVLPPVKKMVQLTDFKGAIAPLANPTVTRALILNEITGAGGPLMVAINNSHFDAQTPTIGAPVSFGGPTEIPTEGTTEVWKIINTTIDAHPMHIHLTQWQIVNRQKFDAAGYMAAYATAWLPKGLPNFPAGATYPGGGGSPYPYDFNNGEGTVGGNPAIGPFLDPNGITLPKPQENGWKDAIIALPGEVSTYICRLAPTEVAIDAPADQKVYSFDPSNGPGYVWHCHIIDHEDMDMMRPMPLYFSPSRILHITVQPAPVQSACEGETVTFSVTATSLNPPLTYQWQISTDAGATWNNVIVGGVSVYSNSLTSTLSISPVNVSLTNTQYRCLVSNEVSKGTPTISTAGILKVSTCSISGTLKYNNAASSLLAAMTVTATDPNVGNKSAVVDLTGKYTIAGVTSGLHTVTVATTDSKYYVGGVNSTDAGEVNYWSVNQSGSPIQLVKFLAGDVTNDKLVQAPDALAIQRHFVFNESFTRTPWSFADATSLVSNNTDPNRLNPITVTVNATTNVLNPVLDILGMVTGDFNGSLDPLASVKSAQANLQLTYGETQKIGANREIELPIRAASSMNVGAVSLILNIPSDLVEVKDIYMKGSNDKLSYNVQGNELKISWYSNTPVNLQAAGDLIVLKLKTTSAFTEGKTMKIRLVSNPLNELANGSFKVITDAVLTTDNLMAINEKAGLVALSAYPNPFSDNSNLNYTLPNDANVTIQIYNLLGVVVKTLVNEHKSAGTYSVKLDASKLSQGTYTAILRINDNNKMVERTVKLVVNK